MENEKILFLAPYPGENSIQDGYFQRIKNIDNLFANKKRSYLMLFFKFKHKEHILESENLNIYYLNFFKSARKIRKLIRESSSIYVHSIYRYFPACLFFKPNQKITLDFHGIVPEELDYSGFKRKSKMYANIEKKAIKRVDNIIVVTKAMKQYICEKYPNNKMNILYFPIITKNVLQNTISNPIYKERDEVVFVYSGNCQAWQRIKDIVMFMNKHNEYNYSYYFLTLDKEHIKKIIDENITKNFKSKIIIETVLPEELGKYYSVADYGFMIRDNHPLNRVANPTKMMEYMYYNIKIIVDLEEIGDYNNYEFIRYDSSQEIVKGKSKINKTIAEEILNCHYDNIVNFI